MPIGGNYYGPALAAGLMGQPSRAFSFGSLADAQRRIGPLLASQAAPVTAAPAAAAPVASMVTAPPGGGGGYAFNSLADAQQRIGPLLASGALGSQGGGVPGTGGPMISGSASNLADMQRQFPGFSLPPNAPVR